MAFKRNIVLLLGEIESSFVINELNFYIEYFERIFVISTIPLKGQERFGNKIIFVLLDDLSYNTSRVLISHSLFFLKNLWIDLVDSKTNLYYLWKIKYLISYFLRSIYYSDRLSEILLKNQIDIEKTVFLSYWFDQSATILSCLVEKGVIENYYSRAHGRDLFEFREPQTGRLPFRKFQFKNVKFVFSVSKRGQDYLKERYPKYKSKIKMAYLGTNDCGEGRVELDDKITILSCAHVRNIKRIHLIPEILMNLNCSVRWIHIGSEKMSSNDKTKELYEIAKSKVIENKNIECIFLGELNANEVIKVYKNYSINLFISLSETEGLPISMMEAISFGVPIISTNVGGCSEIVTDTTGVLIPLHFELDKVSQIIQNIWEEKDEYIFNKEKIRFFWKTNFNLDVNLEKFYNNICS